MIVLLIAIGAAGVAGVAGYAAGNIHGIETGLALAQGQKQQPNFNALNGSVVALGGGVSDAAPTRQAGTGFFVRDSGVLISCHHVILDMNGQAPDAATRKYCVASAAR